MCLTTSTLLYGFCAKTLSLVAAATAWSDGLKTALLAVSLIASRRKNGTLSTTGASRMAQVPVEVWDMVKEVLFRRLAYDAEAKMVWLYHLHHMSLEDYDEAPEFYELPHLFDCERCWQEFTEEGGAPRVFKDNEKPISRDDLPMFDVDCVTPISFPLSTAKSSSFPSTANRLQHQEYGDKPLEFLDFSSAVAQLPNDEAKRRFRRFCTTFPLLEIAQLDAPTVALGHAHRDEASTAATDEDDGKKKKATYASDRTKFRRAREKGVVKEPGWLLLSHSEDCSSG
ncbi:hypothetical protein JCM6882_007223 [Rhodosporidiobolus microsporus]